MRRITEQGSPEQPRHPSSHPPSRAAPKTMSRSRPGRKPWAGYAVAVIGTALAALVRWWLGVTVGQTIPPFITFYPAVICAATLGGVGPGLLATFLSSVAVDILFLP